MGHARGRADRRDGEDDRHLRRAARRSPGPRDRCRRGLLRPARRRTPTGCPISSPTRTAARARSSATCSATTRRRRSSPPCRRFRAERRRRSTAPCRSSRRSASTTRSAAACRSTSWATGRSRPRRPITSRRRSGASASSSRTSPSCSCAASSRDGWGAGPLSLATGLTYREQSFQRRLVSRRDRRARAAVQRAQSRHSRHRHDVVERQPEPAPVLHGVGDLGRATTSGRRSASSTCRSGSPRRASSSSAPASPIGRRTIRASAASTAGRSASISRSFAICACAQRNRATSGRRRSASGSTTRRPAARVLDPASNQASSTVTVTSAGNPDLTPEVGDTTVVGLVYQPRWAEKLRMSIDHYEIDVADWIATLGAQRVVDECYTSNVLCEYVFRDDPGVLSRVFSPYLNLDSGRAVGTDFEIAYRQRRGPLRTATTNRSRFASSAASSTSARARSSAACRRNSRARAGYPDVTANVTLSYRIDAWSVQVQERLSTRSS